MGIKSHKILNLGHKLGFAVRPGAEQPVMSGDEKPRRIASVDRKTVDMRVLMQLGDRDLGSAAGRDERHRAAECDGCPPHYHEHPELSLQAPPPLVRAVAFL